MDSDIEFLQDFLFYDKWRIRELQFSLYSALQKLGSLLRNKESSITIVYESEDTPMYELVELLDGNNFQVNYGLSVFGCDAAKLIPNYPETAEIVYVEEPFEALAETYYTATATATATATDTYYTSVSYSYPPDHTYGLPEKRESFQHEIESTIDKVLKPPWRRKE